jgi:hypothetical protein
MILGVRWLYGAVQIGTPSGSASSGVEKPALAVTARIRSSATSEERSPGLRSQDLLVPWTRLTLDKRFMGDLGLGSTSGPWGSGHGASKPWAEFWHPTGTPRHAFLRPRKASFVAIEPRVRDTHGRLPAVNE